MNECNQYMHKGREEETDSWSECDLAPAWQKKDEIDIT